MTTATQTRTKTHGKIEESHEEWMLRTSLEAEAEANKNGWVSHEQSETNFLKLRADFLRQQQKAA